MPSVRVGGYNSGSCQSLQGTAPTFCWFLNADMQTLPVWPVLTTFQAKQSKKKGNLIFVRNHTIDSIIQWGPNKFVCRLRVACGPQLAKLTCWVDGNAMFLLLSRLLSRSDLLSHYFFYIINCVCNSKRCYTFPLSEDNLDYTNPDPADGNPWLFHVSG